MPDYGGPQGPEPLTHALLHLLEPHAAGLRAIDCWRTFREPRPPYMHVYHALCRLRQRRIVRQVAGKRWVLDHAFRAAYTR